MTSMNGCIVVLRYKAAIKYDFMVPESPRTTSRALSLSIPSRILMNSRDLQIVDKKLFKPHASDVQYPTHTPYAMGQFNAQHTTRATHTTRTAQSRKGLQPQNQPSKAQFIIFSAQKTSQVEFGIRFNGFPTVLRTLIPRATV